MVVRKTVAKGRDGGGPASSDPRSLGSAPPSDSCVCVCVCVCEESVTEKGNVCYMNRVCVWRVIQKKEMFAT